MSTTPFLSEIQLFGFQFAPHNWALCNGQLLPINQNQALFSLLGTTYGGNGVTTFALPDLRGRAPIGVGAGHVLGEKAGAERVGLTVDQLPAHGHAIDLSGVTATARCRNAAANQRTPVAAVPAIEATSVTGTYHDAAADADMRSGAVVLGGSLVTGNSGGGFTHENRQPYITMSYCIALAGIFPSPN
jgi:microcystin-dependent protein